MVNLSKNDANFVVLTSKLDIKTPTLQANFGCAARSRTVNRIYTDELRTAHVVNNDSNIYIAASKLADSANLQRIVDIGCGSGDKLIKYFKDSAIYGLDLAQVIEYTRQLHPTKEWLACNFSSLLSLEATFSQFLDGTPQLLILANVLECIPDPRNLLKTLRTILQNNPSNRLFIATPAREKMSNSLDVPSDDRHIREWTLEELASLLYSSGFKLERYGYNQESDDIVLSYVELSCSPEYFEEFLLGSHLSKASPLLLVTNEHALTKSTGGIGSYIQELEKLCEEQPLIVFLGLLSWGDQQLLPDNFITPDRFFVKPVDQDWDHANAFADLAWETVEQLLFYYDSVKLIEYQDYLGLGARIAQAKHAGLINSHITTKVVCHGSLMHTSSISQEWHDLSAQPLLLKEKVSLELAEIVSFPTLFLQKLYADYGYDIKPDQAKIERLPFEFTDSFKTEQQIQPINTLIFFGKRSAAKGFPEFVAALKLFFADATHKALIKKIILIGPKIAELVAENTYIDQLKRQLEVIELSLPRNEALEAISAYSPNALCVMPYRADNHPYSVLEVINCNCQLLAFNAGGISELIPEQFITEVLCVNSVSALKQAIDIQLGKSLEQRIQLIKNIKIEAQKRQQVINQEIRNRIKRTPSVIPAPLPTISSDLITVVITCFNTNLNYVADLIFSLNQQTILPHKVIFVDDGSESEYPEALEQLVKKELKLPFQVIKHEKNLGLPFARNTGIANTTTKYLLSHDSDDILLNDFIYQMLSYLERYPDVAVVTPYNSMFMEFTPWQVSDINRTEFRPIGQSLSFGFMHNFFGTAAAAFRADTLRDIGGWDTQDKSMWEDWALYLKLTCAGKKIAISPKPGYLYRVCKNSMLKTHNIFQAEQRLARNLISISRFDAFCLQGMLRKFIIAGEKLEYVEHHLQHAQQQLKRLSFRIPAKIVHCLTRVPILKKLVIISLAVMRKIYGKLRQISKSL